MKFYLLVLFAILSSAAAAGGRSFRNRVFGRVKNSNERKCGYDVSLMYF